MKKRMLYLLAIAIASLNWTQDTQAQISGVPVEQWRSFLPYNQVKGIATDNTTFFVGTEGGFFTYNRDDGMLTPYSKVNGMSDVDVVGVAYDGLTRTAVLGYANSNIDIFKNGVFYNLPELKSAQGSGDKTIYQVTATDGQAYLSTAIGLVILNLNKREVKETVVFYENALTASVYGTTIDDNNYIYAATSVGLFRTLVTNPNLVNYASWDKLSEASFDYIAHSQGKVYVAFADSLHVFSNGIVDFVEQYPHTITHLDSGIEGLWVSSAQNDAGQVVKRLADGTPSITFVTNNPSQVIELANSEVWYGDRSRYSFPDSYGFRRRSESGSELFIPDGPVTASGFDIAANNGSFWVAHGGFNNGYNPTYNRSMLSYYSRDGKWRHYPWLSNNEWTQDIIRVLQNPYSGNLYASSFSGGLVVIEPSGAIYNYASSEYLSHKSDESHLFFVTGLALDKKGNLWIGNNRGMPELTVKTADDKWYKMRTITDNGVHSILDIVIDDYDQKWFIAPNNGGVVVYDDNGTIENNNDDRFRILRTGKGAGNMPTNLTRAIAKDKNGYIWIGTTDGIGIVKCPGNVISGECEGELEVVQEDAFAGYLFQGQSITAIAVDGANRKWIGTSFGVWLVSENADKTIYRFTENNSPLPSSNIQRINIDPVTGDVYFCTAKGIACFRSTATEGTAQNEKPLFVYPNPVPSNFGGMIAIRGIAENSDVRITDISGQLVYRTQALGGQAVWNGFDYTGRKAQSGVYLVFTVNKDGTEKASGKFIIHR